MSSATNTIDCSSESDEPSCNALNTLAEEQNKEIEAEFSTKYVGYLYQLERNHLANLYIYWLYWLYGIVAAVFVFFLIRGANAQSITWTMKVVYIILIIMFPFVIVPIELKLKDILMAMYKIMMGQPIQVSQWKVFGESNITSKYGVKKDNVALSSNVQASSAPINWFTWS